ncbi:MULTISPECIES: tol-pal system YbgF family protein [unclassified Mucilaginibacter]|uniref:tetratricopeptide repeat protein n=1 Tax=unclassified Mucilaginibacter TaxID=2617802 RepID=UPI00138B88C2|nr:MULTISPECIES: tetratricopeptide repeat protein [unclassified Mucilaginibacter]MBB5396493.1 tetratricopeptide (TPR) repeat protein [Mucilaginibacter sp. AK015]QHS55611.1 tetratricopeptide repeat protein [Mucilaginibacter sp. 14171R-50]
MSATEVKSNTTATKNNVVKGGSFVQENQKSLIFIAAAIVVMIVIYVAYLKLYLAPREVTAANQMHVAQDFWANKDWDKAINGDNGYPGFKKIITDYSNTKVANLAYFYLGTAYLNKGEYRQAIDNLTNYRGDDNMVAAEALGSTGDAYVELKDYDKAETYFKKAADKASNKFLSPFYLKKLGLVYEAKKDYKSAVDTYKKIKTDYFDSAEAQNIDEYIARAEAK